MSDVHYHNIRRAIIAPTFSSEPKEQLAVLQRSYSQLAQEVILCHNRVFVDQLTVGGGIGTLIVTLPAPYPDTFYTPLAILSWNAYAYVTAIAVNQYTLTFSAASPGGGGTVRVIIIR